MYGDRESENRQITQHGSPESERFEPIKDISDIKLPVHRRLNDYTTIPRKPQTYTGHHGLRWFNNTGNHRHHGQAHHHHDNHSPVYRVKPEYLRQSTEGVHNVQECFKSSLDNVSNVSHYSGSTDENIVSKNTDKKHKPRSFKDRLKNVLKRSKSLKSEKDIRNSDESLVSSATSKVSGILFSTIDPTKANRLSKKPVIDPVEAGWYASKSVIDPVKAGWNSNRTVSKDEEDIYDDIDNLRLQSIQSQKEISDNSSCKSGHSESNMSVTLPGYKVGSDPQHKSSQKSGVLKALSSITLRNIGTKKSPKKKEPDYISSEFHRDTYGRSSLHDNSVVGKRLSNSDCRRIKSFTMSTVERVTRHDISSPAGAHRDSDIYSKQTEYETRDSETLYSLAQADDQPPPLPERTYLKLRAAAHKENEPSDNLYKIPPGYNTRGEMSFPLQEQNSDYKPAAYPNTVPDHLRLQQDRHFHAMTPIQRRRRRHDSGHGAAKPFMLHQHLVEGDQRTVSSGYSSSVASDTLSSELDYPRLPPPPPPSVCTLPRRSRHLMSHASKLVHQSSSCESYGNVDQDKVTLRRSDTQKSEEEDHIRTGITSNVIHNLPLPPGPGGAQLVRTLKLDTILKNKWISGIAVTKKNEYIVVDQREAYLMDEDGALKKIVGAKNSGRLIEPFNVCVSPSNGNLVICDHAEQDIKIYTWKGQFVKKVKDPGLNNIAGVAVTENKDIVIAGTDKQRISILAEDGSLSYTIPSVEDSNKPKSRLPFEHPYSVSVNPLTGDIIIGDDYKHMVTAISVSESGTARVLWRYCPGPGDRHFFPSSICADSKGYIFIADLYNEKVYMLDSSGKFVKTLLSRGDGLRGGPGAIAVDGRGHILVSDEEKTIKVFKYRDENGFAVPNRYSYCPQAT